MCGIAGFIDFTNNSSPEILKACTDVLQHRGPDGSGYEFLQLPNCQLAMGHRRLSIIDLSNAAAQPMWYKHFCIIFNGEIYNYAEIKITLQQLGHNFNTQSDTEVILHAYEQWGTAMVQRFIGMFAFVIFDKEKAEVICFRDRAGVKPFYYYWQNDVFIFASELKSFHKHPAFKKEINEQALHQFLQYGFIMAPLSIFKNASKLLPGHFLQIDIAAKKITTRQYWNVYDFYNKPKLNISESDAKMQVEALLISACKYRMVSDVPVGVFLSGGYDSTAVTALLQAHQSEKLKTFSIGFYEDEHNEAHYAKQVATHLKTDHTEYYCTAKEAQEIIPEIAFFCDEPFGDASIIPTTLVSRLAKKQVTVALSADAGDEIFAGYNKYAAAINYLKKFNKIPDALRSSGGNILEMMPGFLLDKITGNTATSLKRNRIAALLRKKDITSDNVMDLLLSQVYTSDQLKNLFTSSVEKPSSFFDETILQSEKNNSLDSMLALDYKTYLPDDIMAKVDRAGMSASLEGREPLLDHRLIEFVATLPENLKMNGTNKKYLLKEIVHKYVPKEIMERPKMGFGVPVFDWLKNDLHYLLEEFMSESAFKQHNLFNWQEVQHIRNKFFAGDRNYSSLFWYLLIFQMWYKKWMA